jgi:hypothetical protein
MRDEEVFAVREQPGAGWQVLFTAPREWRTCRSEREARFISNGMAIAAAVNRGEHFGEETAQELDEAMTTLVRNIGHCSAEQILKESAGRARGETSYR